MSNRNQKAVIPDGEGIVNVKESKLRKLELWAIILAAAAFLFDVGWNYFVERPQDIADRMRAEETRDFQAWSLLSSRTPGAGGKVNALKFLSQKGPVIGLDLSCDFVNSNASIIEDCSNPIILRELTNSKKDKVIDIRNSDLSGSWIIDWNLTGANFVEVKFDNVKFFQNKFLKSEFLHCSFVNANLRVQDFSNTKFANSDLYNSDFSFSNLSASNFSGNELNDYIYLNGANISGANFGQVRVVNFPTGQHPANYLKNSRMKLSLKYDGKYLRDDFFSYSWAWADNPPIIPEGYKGPVLCVVDKLHIEKFGRNEIPKECQRKVQIRNSDIIVNNDGTKTYVMKIMPTAPDR